ncbi:hypothetical protein OS493_009674 [Desmophyllum pertusum]|uniref:Transmembrane protein n=1 Tax=Desmophyllum pertusum TaxID=174260 RepID=A0A9X0CNP1_9CNID|nr:hypothetical protein OS493_009674 [Desmophyllum pertusum]
MARKTGIYRRAVARIFSVSLLVLQGVILDYYLIVQESSSWWFAWIITDAVVLFAWVFTMWMSHRKSRSLATTATKDEIKFAYLAWIVYAVHLVPQVATLFKLKAPVLDERLIFGPNMLKMNLCLTPMLFLFLVYAHHDAKSHSRRKYYLEKMTAAVTLDLFDSVEMMEYLFDKDKITLELENAILAFSCMNIFLPTFALFELRFNKFHDSGEISPVSFKFIYICSFMFFVNVPFLVLRLILWHGHHLDISVLLAKNALAIVMGMIEIFEFIGEQRPRRCESCSRTFAKAFFKSHVKTCSPDGNLEMIARDEMGSNGILNVDVHIQEPEITDTMHNVSVIDNISPATFKRHALEETYL